MKFVWRNAPSRLSLGALMTVALIASGCGDDAGPDSQSSSIECGENTELVDGKCVSTVEEPADGETCGEGTVWDGETCVIDEDAAEELFKPVVNSVTLDSLIIPAEGVHPLTAQHPLEASATFSIDAEEPFVTIAVLGLESADGAQSCIVGLWEVEHEGAGGSGSDGESLASVTASVSETFYVQKGCEALAGQTDAKAWVSFDPFGRTKLDGRTIAINDEEGTQLTPLDIIEQSRLALDNCAAGDGSSHPDSCETALEVAASPGKDIAMTDLMLGSRVAVLEYIEDNPANEIGETAGSYTDPVSGETIQTDGLDTVQLKDVRDQSPHFSITSDLLVYGQDSDEDGADELEDGDVGLVFDIRPAVDRAEFPDEAAEAAKAFDWAPLTAIYRTPPSRAGEEATLEELEQEFLDGIAGPTLVHKSSPIFISDFVDDLGEEHFVRSRILDGLWSHFDRFELRVCAQSDMIDEAGIGDDAQANNCKIEQVVVLREGVKSTLETPESEGSAWSNLQEKKWDDSWGSSDLSIGLELVGQVHSNQDRARGEAFIRANLRGFWSLQLAFAGLWGADHYSSSDWAGAWVDVLGLRLFGTTIPFPDGSLSLSDFGRNVIEVSKEKQKCKSVWVKVTTVKICGSVAIAAGLDAGAEKSGIADDFDAANAIDGGQGVRYVAYEEGKNWWDAKIACQQKGGELAVPYTDNASTLFNGLNQQHTYWLGGDSACGSPKHLQSQIPDLSQDTDYQRWCTGELSWFDRVLEDLYKPMCAIREGQVALATLIYDECQHNFTNASNWVSSGWEGGTMGADHASINFNSGEPNDWGSGENGVDVHQGRLNDRDKAGHLYYVCEYRTGGNLELHVTPYSTVSFEATASLDWYIFELGAYATVDVLELKAPVVGGINWGNARNKFIVKPYTGAHMELNTLSGEIGGFAEWWDPIYGDERADYAFYAWDGVNLGKWQLWFRR